MANIATKIYRAIPKSVRKKSKPILQAALRSGARNVGMQLSQAIKDPNQPTDTILTNLSTAVKSGVLDAATDFLTWGLDRSLRSRKRR